MILSFDSRDSLLRHLAEDDSDTPYLILENFQSIASPTAIPLRSLTFLYGPNSAGKSAIGDAIEVLRSLWSGTERPTDLPERSRRTGSWISIGLSIRSNLLSLSDDLSEAITADLPDGSFFDSAVTEQSPRGGSPWEDGSPVRITWFADNIGRFWGAATSEEYATYIGTRLLATLLFKDDKDAGYRFQLRVHRDALMALSATKSNYDRLTKCLRSSFDSDESRSAFLDRLESEIGQGFDRYETAREVWGDEADRTNQTQIVRTYAPVFEGAWLGLKFEPRFFQSREDASDSYFLRLVFSGVLASFGGFVDWNLVGPTRTIPKHGNLRFLKEDKYLRLKPLDVETELADVDSGNAWERIATSCLKRSLDSRSEESMLDSVNRWLGQASKDSFATGYQVKADIQFLLKREEFSKSRSKKAPLLTISEGTLDHAPTLVDLRIVNPAGKTLSLQDVGTGFSHVVPVIVGTLSRQNNVMIQQPELHLHPDLQGKIVDLLIEALNRKKRRPTWFRIIETHSEHVAIRLLRRMRETSQPTTVPSGNTVVPDDAALLYFEPRGNGTVVHEIRISADGEFIDRWPRGFFTEKEEDLFGSA
jgi:hypothetical protein